MEKKLEELRNIEDSTIKWAYGPAFQNFDKVLTQQVIQLIYTSRYSAFFHLAISPNRELTDKQVKSIEECDPKGECPPLFQHVPSTLIQVITNSLFNFFLNGDLIIDKFWEYFKDKSCNATIFSMLTFPSIFFFFQTSEFNTFGYNFLYHAIERTKVEQNPNFSDFILSLIESYFDNFPRFISKFWDSFESNIDVENKPFYNSFILALKSAFCLLTKNHRDILIHLHDTSEPLFRRFLFEIYFPLRTKCHYSYDNKNPKFSELLSLFDFCARNGGSIHTQTIKNVIFESDTFLIVNLSYYSDIKLPVIYSIFSGVEIQMLFDLYKTCGIIKMQKTLPSMVLKEDVVTSLEPGYIQYSHHKFFKGPYETFENLIYRKCEAKNYEKDEVNNRVWVQIEKLSIDVGQGVAELLLTPKDIYTKRIIDNSDIAKTENFIDFALVKTHHKKQKIEQNFEDFLKAKWVFNELALIQHDFIIGSSIYMQEYVINKFVYSARKTSFMEETITLPKKLMSPSIEFISNIFDYHFNEPNDGKVLTVVKSIFKNPCQIFQKESYLSFLYLIFVMNHLYIRNEEIENFVSTIIPSNVMYINEYDSQLLDLIIKRSKKRFATLKGKMLGNCFFKMNEILCDVLNTIKYYFGENDINKFVYCSMKVIVLSGVPKVIECILFYGNLNVYPKIMSQMSMLYATNWNAPLQGLSSILNKQTKKKTLPQILAEIE